MAKKKKNRPRKTSLSNRLKAKKNGRFKFEEENRLGALGRIPEPRLALSGDKADLGAITPDTTQWKKIKLLNVGGGASEKWTVSGVDEVLSMNRTAGNLRREQEVYYRIHPAGLEPGEHYEKTLMFSGENGSSVKYRIRFQLTDPKK